MPNQQSEWSLISWRSGHLKRNVESTLGSETQSLLRGVKEVEWVKALWIELRDGLDLENREKALQAEPTVAITDCKSAYDALTGISTTSIADRTTALDALVIRQILARAGIQMRWIPGALQVADATTKDSATACDLLRSCMKTGAYTISDEIETLQKRAQEKQVRLERGQKRAREAEELKDGAVSKKATTKAKGWNKTEGRNKPDQVP